VPTKLLYQEQGSLHQHEASITGVEALPRPDDANKSEQPAESHVLYLDETIFHVQGGGQPFDVGTIRPSQGSANGNDTASEPENQSEFHVTSVRNGEANTVRHAGYFLPATLDSRFQHNTKVHLSIDVPRRQLHSRIHSAGHILGVAIMRLSRAGTLPPLTETKAKHYPGDASVEFQGLIDGKFKDAIQQATDELVAEERPLHIRFWSREECEKNGVALPEKMDGDLFRAVEIEGCGAYACGGTHASKTNEVGRVVVRSIRRQKGGTRVGYQVEEK
jgi:Ser-tRNA(Ala) deacylase AlaX